MKTFVVEADKLTENIQTVKAIAGDVKIYAVLKGQAYGMGLLETARAVGSQGIHSFAVCEPDDAAALREAGFESEEILLMSQVNDEETITRLIGLDAVFTVGSYACAEQLNKLAAPETPARAHVKIDTGMGRFGFLPSDCENIIKLYSDFENIRFEGIYTHLHSAWSNAKASKKQLGAFDAVVAAIKNAGYNPGIRHAANSPAFLNMPFSRLDAVRVGSVFTGRVAGFGNKLKQVGYIQTSVLTVRSLSKGSTVGYGAAARLKRDSKVAVIPVGYADGFGVTRVAYFSGLREFLAFVKDNLLTLLGKNPRVATIGGKQVRVIGKIGMCNCILDVTHIDCQPGDPVLLNASPVFCGALMPRIYK